VANLKQGHGRRGRPSKSPQNRRSAKRSTTPEKEQEMKVRGGNGKEEARGREEFEHSTADFGRAAKLFREATSAGLGGMAPQVMGWAAEGPAQQIESMMRQFWNFSDDGASGRYARALAQANVELVGLLGRRSRAYLDWPAHLARCRSPQQFWDEQAKFLQDMLQDYQVTNDRVMNCWLEANAPPRT